MKHRTYLIPTTLASFALAASCTGLHCDAVADLEVLHGGTNWDGVESVHRKSHSTGVPFEMIPEDSWPRTIGLSTM